MQVPAASPPPAQPSRQSPLLIAPRQQYNTGLLSTMVLLGAIYAAWLYTRQTVTGSNFWDAALGVLLGIYICSRPVGNLMDMLYAQNIRWNELRKRAGITWLVMNFVTTFVGWATIVLGATRMVRPD
jgi:hypothetical protein